jgi:putative addiction module component (TIGR02574 family)
MTVTTQPLSNPPPGFEELSKDEQIEYIQELWNRVASDEDEIPIPEWHRQLLRERLATTDSEDAESWAQIKNRLSGRSRG